MAAGACEFWYLSWGDPRSGYLLDLIQRPDQAVARLAIFRRGEPPRLLREVLARDALRLAAGDGGVALGPWRLDSGHCSGGICGWAVTCDLQLQPSAITLVPAWIGRLFPALPAMRSTPGTVTRATVTAPAAGTAPGAAAPDEQRDLPSRAATRAARSRAAGSPAAGR